MGWQRLAGTLLLGLTIASAGFFDIEQVNEIRLSFAEPNWDEILDSLYAAGEEGRLIGTAVINGQRFDSVGVRYKGGSSYSPGRRKNPFNIKVDYVRPGQTIEGHGTLRLANVFNDPSFVREALSYEIARLYMPAGRSNYANIYVNDTLLGLYSNNEDPGRMFMRTHFYCDENARFKGRLTNNSQMIGWKYLGPDPTPYRDYFELQSDSGWTELVSLLDTLNNFTEVVDRVLNVDRHLWMLAFDALLVNLDAPINMPQNFYLYRDAARRFNPIVCDLNESFGVFRNLIGVGTLTLGQMQQLDPFLRQNDTNYPIASKILSNPRLRRMYVAHMKTMIAEVFSNNWYRQRALEIQDIIDSYVQADPNKFYSYNDFLNNITRSVGTGPLAVVGLTELMNPRISFILNDSEFRASAPTIGAVTANPYPAVPGGLLQFTVDVANADSVWVGWRQSPGFRFVLTPLYDDGLHGDGAAGDGGYGTAVRIGAGDVHYYIYAENRGAGTFMPARAEQEYLSLPVTGRVVINELMADNVGTVRDPSGEYDDWIELHNPTNSAVGLDGFLLTDDSATIAKWVFPDVTIPAGGYLLIWADGDTNQPGLHANFQLSSSGETVLFADDDGRPLDCVTFGPQRADISYGRFPDGAGLFRLMSPTPERANQSGIGVSEEVATVTDGRYQLVAWPNPFRSATRISYLLSCPARVSLRVYDAAGRLAAGQEEYQPTLGWHGFDFRPESTVGAGVYFVQLTVNGNSSTCTKLVMTR